jgi:hypothetical protein
MMSGRGNRVLWRKPAPVPFCPQTPTCPSRTRTRAAAVGRQQCYLNLEDKRQLLRFGGMCCPRFDILRRCEVSVSSKTAVLFFTRLQEVTSQKTVIFMFTAFSTSDLTYFTCLKWGEVILLLSFQGKAVKRDCTKVRGLVLGLCVS